VAPEQWERPAEPDPVQGPPLDQGPALEQGPAPDAEPGPPPAPAGDLASSGSSVTVAPARRRRSPLGAAVMLVALVVAAGGGFVGGLYASDRIAVPEVLRDRAVVEAEQDAALVALLEDIIRTEGVMLAFNEAVGERIEGLDDRDAALAIVAEEASASVGGLRSLRPIVVDRTGGARVDEVRTVYLPHLDSWIDYLAALAEEPGLLFTRDEQQPYILLINATADAFRIALEDLIEAGPSARAAELAERILDDGFRSEGPDPTV
jgi:hypothetical protein